MSRFVYQGTLQDGNGKRLADGNVAVLLAGTATPASIYAAATGGVAVASVATDTAGEWAFYIDEADYAGTQRFDVVMSKSGYLSITLEDIEVLPASAHVGLTVKDATTNSKQLTVDISGATAAKTMTLASAHTDDRTLTLPDETGTLLSDEGGVVAVNIDGGIVSAGTGSIYNVAEVNIGDWDMDSATGAAFIAVSHGIADYKKIRKVSAAIRSDTDTSYNAIDNVDTVTPGTVTPQGGVAGWFTTTVTLERLTGGFFDSAAYSSTPFNRGFITIWYVD